MVKKVNKKSSRDENLYVLSHEHHQGLIFAVRLKKAEKADSDTLKDYIKDFWETSLESHFDSEEKLFIDAIGNMELKNRFLSEHIKIRTLQKEIEISDNNVVERAKRFGLLINDHIRFEERILFPWLQENLTTDELKFIGSSLDDVDVCSHAFTPRFWEK
jgi:hemerythrin-like domain-containing protein